MNAAVEILQSAREVISTPDKWVKGKWGDDEGRRCAWGALCEVIEMNPVPVRMVTIASRALDEAVPFGFGYITFNDREETTHEDILALFDAAIKSVANVGADQ